MTKVTAKHFQSEDAITRHEVEKNSLNRTTMLALATTHQLSLIDPQALRRPPSSLPSCLSLLAPCTASAWSPDNLYLFLSSPNTIHQYNPALNTLTDIFSSPETVTHLVCKTRSSLAFATADKIHILESTKVVQTFDSHKAPITSLALSNDLLASTSAGAAHVHNLLLGSHTILRGLNLAGQRITACAFHPHSRARLLLGVGKQLIVYDTTRPSGPSKIIPMNDTSTGDIVSVACSPFSKTLVAVASASGNVGLVDLDKEKGYASRPYNANHRSLIYAIHQALSDPQFESTLDLHCLLSFGGLDLFGHRERKTAYFGPPSSGQATQGRCY